jgi:hypothetical protein
MVGALILVIQKKPLKAHESAYMNLKARLGPNNQIVEKIGITALK